MFQNVGTSCLFQIWLQRLQKCLKSFGLYLCEFTKALSALFRYIRLIAFGLIQHRANIRQEAPRPRRRDRRVNAQEDKAAQPISDGSAHVVDRTRRLSGGFNEGTVRVMRDGSSPPI